MVGRTARIALTEPVNQGFLRPDTKVVGVKERTRRRRRGGALHSLQTLAGGDTQDSDGSNDSMMSDDEDEEDAPGLSTFSTAPPSSRPITLPAHPSPGPPVVTFTTSQVLLRRRFGFKCR